MQRITRISLLATLLGSCVLIAAQAQTDPRYPVIKPGETEYTVPKNEATGLVIQNLYLPRGFTLKVADDVDVVDWSVKNIHIEEDVTIDLSAPQVKPPVAGNGVPFVQTQANYCIDGNAGAPGQAGSTGRHGTNLFIRDVRKLEIAGSLWIRTDGGPGGDGGNGGYGQQGGGHRKHPPFGSGCGAGRGGNGGAQGAAGPGGETSTVKFFFKDNSDSIPDVNGVSATCGRSQRPNSAQGPSGVIAIWGAKGCPGKPGNVGLPGGRG